MSVTLEQLGLSVDGVRDVIVSKVSDELFEQLSRENGEDIEARILKDVRARVEELMEERIDKVIGEAIEPRINEIVDNLVFQETNNWGEPKKPPMSLREKALNLAEQWMSEPVNYNGESKKQSTYNWSAHGTRIIHMVERRLQHTIDEAVKAAVADVNSKIAGGIAAAVKQTMTDVLSKTKIQATPPR